MGVNSNRVEDFSGLETSVRGLSSSASAEAAMVVVGMPPVEVHRVCLPPTKTTIQKLKHRLSEIFFPDDPLYRFKNQSCFRKLVLGLQFFFPIFHWAPTYSLALLRSDIISGLTIASLAIPQVSHTATTPYIVFRRVGLCFFFVSYAGNRFSCRGLAMPSLQICHPLLGYVSITMQNLGSV